MISRQLLRPKLIVSLTVFAFVLLSRPVLAQQRSMISDKARKDSSTSKAVGKQLKVDSLIGPMPAAPTLLGKLNLSSAYDESLQADQVRSDEANSHEANNDEAIAGIDGPPFGDGGYLTAQTFCWTAPNFYHQPLYFEQPNLERFGVGPRRVLQPWSSALAFYGRLPLLPAAMLKNPPRSREYTLGYPRPGE